MGNIFKDVNDAMTLIHVLDAEMAFFSSLMNVPDAEMFGLIAMYVKIQNVQVVKVATSYLPQAYANNVPHQFKAADSVALMAKHVKLANLDIIYHLLPHSFVIYA